MSAKQDLTVQLFASRQAWRAWLAAQHAASPGLWLKIAKKGAGVDSVTYSEALDVALCFGWIDCQKDKLDAVHWLQRFTPRQARSRWSKANRERVEKLLASGEMEAAGRREVDAARQDGRWDAAYDGQRTITVPADLQRELDANRKARDFFATLDSANRYAILYRLHDAKKPETRARRLAKFVAMLAAGEKIHG
jgi:uncharacterized protein YdeI (YjbR/CyaY-like superfamily)